MLRAFWLALRGIWSLHEVLVINVPLQPIANYLLGEDVNAMMLDVIRSLIDCGLLRPKYALKPRLVFWCNQLTHNKPQGRTIRLSKETSL